MMSDDPQKMDFAGSKCGQATSSMPLSRILIPWIAALLILTNTGSARAQGPSGNVDLPSSDVRTKEISVKPIANDTAIAARIQKILRSTGWFRDAHVDVQEGVVFLRGVTNSLEHQRWAGRLAEDTEGAVAVVNRLDIEADAESTFALAREELTRLTQQVLQSWPWTLLAIIIVLISWLLSLMVRHLSSRLLSRRISSPLLLRVVVRLISIPILILGVYFVLRVAGLTRLAITLLGGTGLLGIVAGLAFRDIAENFLASILLSVRNPFHQGDLIEVDGTKGIVQNLNMRTTALLTLEGNYVQIPNAIVFKNTIINYSSAKSRRADFVVGIGYRSTTREVQALIANVLKEHPAVLATPEPLVLVQELAAATVNLRVYYWFDSATYSPDKISSSLMRLSKDALLAHGVELPDPAREVIFPEGIPLAGSAGAQPMRRVPPTDREQPASAVGEGDLRNEIQDVNHHSGVQEPNLQANLLRS